jgi:hypothetical protein
MVHLRQAVGGPSLRVNQSESKGTGQQDSCRWGYGVKVKGYQCTAIALVSIAPCCEGGQRLGTVVPFIMVHVYCQLWEVVSFRCVWSSGSDWPDKAFPLEEQQPTRGGEMGHWSISKCTTFLKCIVPFELFKCIHFKSGCTDSENLDWKVLLEFVCRPLFVVVPIKFYKSYFIAHLEFYINVLNTCP